MVLIPLAKETKELLSRVFGFSKFRPGQEEIVNAVMAENDLLAILPTGAGKSLCFQLPAINRVGITIVVSPLIALMRDQVAQLQGIGIAAASLNSTVTDEESASVYQSARDGTLKLLYLSPERLVRADTMDFLTQINVAAIAVDEAHCVSQWGHDFRPEYQQIATVRDALNGVQVIAFTATADAQTRRDIEEKLFTAPPLVFQHGFDRPNIHLAMTPRDNPRDQLMQFLDSHNNESGIIYCQSRKKVEDTARFLKSNGVNAYPYHAGLDKQIRADHQDIFLREDGVVIVATIAFGMGIDKPDVRFVLHMDLPKNIEGYYQEIGRAGRDNLPADTLTLYGLNEIRQYRQWIDEGDADDQQKRIEHQKLSSLVALCEAPLCRRITLLAYFGDISEPCGNCDLCQGKVSSRDGTIDAQKALSAILRTEERFGMEHVISVLRGQETERTLKFQHQNLSTFGIGSEYSRADWQSVFRQIYALGLVYIDVTRFNCWRVTEDGWKVLRNEEKVRLREILPPRSKVKKITYSKTNSPAPENCNAEVLAALKEWRLELAREKKQPAFVIFPDRTLIELASHLPSNRQEMKSIHGIGEKKMDQFGDMVLSIIDRLKS